MNELKPCPFCGETETLGKVCVYMNTHNYGLTNTYAVVCEGCGAGTKDCNEPEEAIGAWNRRDGVKMNTEELSKDGILIVKAKLNVQKYVDELIQKAIEQEVLAKVVRCKNCVRSEQYKDSLFCKWGYSG